ncbi:hypothetical protein ARMSODRAFT_1044096 [Armillaria solidipes]|uniref:Uncharacterized protein n=1 Tax=Armillaria solidipes TaxID=1076256 RepID=A0A2H3BAU7_9AGAR|nr:hypothetical protein ARMSODRAFT_1044096 [Armillaria solidipes]
MLWPHHSWRNTELFWIWHYQFLQDNGYQLRPKFRPDWKPNWKTDDDILWSEESLIYSNPSIMDATRIKDKKLVTLNKVSRTRFPYEVDLALFPTSPPLSDDPKNHCVPIYEVLQSPYEFDVRRFSTLGEFLDAFRQMFHGLEFTHRNFMAHGDITILNVILDSNRLYPKGSHPIHPSMNAKFTGFASHITRTKCWPRYYLIDFGSSR